MPRRKFAAVDTETEPVRSRPDYPPKSVGYAIKVEGRRPEYLAFGHPTGNNCTKREAQSRLREVLRDCTPIFHNADFDIEVLARDGLRVTGEYHDTMRLAFLNEPRSRDLGLKPQAEQFLGEPPEERDYLKQWIIANIPEARKRARKDKRTGQLTLSNWGDYICRAPGAIVAPYAKGDVERTDRLYDFFAEEINAAGMVAAYEREMALIPIKLDMEQRGIKVRLAKLKREFPAFVRLRDRMAEAIRQRLRQPKGFNPGSDKQLADALVERGLLSTVMLTKTGKVSTKRVLLEQYCTDRRLTLMLAVYGTLSTYIGTFLEPWIDIAERNNGYIQPTFNTVRRADEYGDGKGFGTRTGRFSSSDPNFQNIPANVEESQHRDTLLELQRLLRSEGVNFMGLRDYFEPDEGCVFLRRDYNQQELRFLAHFDEAEFLKMYLSNPKMDAHDAVRLLVLQQIGKDYPRKHIKVTNFGLIYGMGLAKLAARMGLPMEEARELKTAVLNAVSGIKRINMEMKKLAKRGEPFYTWGGRRYYCEEPLYIPTEDGGKTKRTFEYKMLNTLIQGSAADCTKVGMINTHQNMRHGRIVLQVHDELLVSVPREHAREEMRRMREAMEDVELRLPMLTDGEIGRVSWAGMAKTDSLKTGDITTVWRGL